MLQWSTAGPEAPFSKRAVVEWAQDEGFSRQRRERCSRHLAARLSAGEILGRHAHRPISNSGSLAMFAAILRASSLAERFSANAVARQVREREIADLRFQSAQHQGLAGWRTTRGQADDCRPTPTSLAHGIRPDGESATATSRTDSRLCRSGGRLGPARY